MITSLELYAFMSDLPVVEGYLKRKATEVKLYVCCINEQLDIERRGG